MKYNYRWVHQFYLKKIKKKAIPLKGHEFLFNNLPIIDKGKYKGCVGVGGLILCMVLK